MTTAQANGPKAGHRTIWEVFWIQLACEVQHGEKESRSEREVVAH